MDGNLIFIICFLALVCFYLKSVMNISFLIYEGSGIGCLAIADLVCEFIFLYIHRNNIQFRQNKITVCNLAEDVNTELTKI